MDVEPTPSNTEVHGGDPADQGEGGEDRDGDDGRDRSVIAAALAMTVLVLIVTDYAAQQLPIPLALASVAIVGAITLVVLLRSRHPAEAVGGGFYITSVLLVLAPFALYVPRIVFDNARVRMMAQNVTAQNVTIGGGVFFEAGNVGIESISSGEVTNLIALVIFTVVFLLAGAVTAVLGWAAKSYASSALEEQRRGERRRTR